MGVRWFRGFVGGVSSSDPVHFGVFADASGVEWLALVLIVGCVSVAASDCPRRTGFDDSELFVVCDALVLGGLSDMLTASQPSPRLWAAVLPPPPSRPCHRTISVVVNCASRTQKCAASVRETASRSKAAVSPLGFFSSRRKCSVGWSNFENFRCVFDQRARPFE